MKLPNDKGKDARKNVEAVLYHEKTINGVDQRILIKRLKNAFDEIVKVKDDFKFSYFDIGVASLVLYNPESIFLAKPQSPIEITSVNVKFVDDDGQEGHLVEQLPKILVLQGSECLVVQNAGVLVIPTRCFKCGSPMASPSPPTWLNPHCSKAGCGQWWCLSCGVWRIGTPDAPPPSPAGHHQ
jgi:hypothetical protein